MYKRPYVDAFNFFGRIYEGISETLRSKVGRTKQV